MASRREFLRTTALASSMLLVPKFLLGMGRPTVPLMGSSNGKRLIVIQLTGGNDGLNTVVPFLDDLYYKARPTLAIPSAQVLPLDLDKGLGFHPAMEKLRLLYDQGYLTVLNNVGYPDPDRSHFRSMDIWQTGSASREYLNTGWLGRYLDSCPEQSILPYTAIEVDDLLSLALKGKQRSGLAVQNVDRFYQASQDGFLRQLTQQRKHSTDVHEHPNVEYLYKTLIDIQQSAQYLHATTKAYRSSQRYPGGEFGRNLKTIAELICSGTESRVYYASLTGFDTHVNQAEQQAKQLKELSEGLYSLVQDLGQHRELDSTLILVFSEFGRRVEQNASNGTDHGTANNVFMLGTQLRTPGFYNNGPNLQHLDHGDLTFTTDFRQLYASILQDWLQADPKSVLSKKFTPLNKLLS